MRKIFISVTILICIFAGYFTTNNQIQNVIASEQSQIDDQTLQEIDETRTRVANANPDDYVYFKDERLKRDINSIIANFYPEFDPTNDNATVEQMKKITVLSTFIRYDDFSGLEYAVNMKEIMSYDRFEEYERIDPISTIPFSTMDKLEKIHINGNLDISGLLPITTLKSVNLAIDITANNTLEALSNSPNIEYLQLIVSKNEVIKPNLNALSNLTNIKTLILNKGFLPYTTSNPNDPIYDLIDISPLQNLTNLERLEMPKFDIGDISPLSAMNNLEYLNLNYNSISDLSPISNLQSLKELSLFQNKVKEIPEDVTMPSIENIDLYNNLVTDISSINNLTTLESFSSRYGGLKSIPDLSNLINLKELDLSGNSITDINGISELNNLEDLTLSQNNIEDISVLANLTNLTSLSLSDNHIIDASPLSSFYDDLSYLSLGGQEIVLDSQSYSSDSVYDLNAFETQKTFDLYLPDGSKQTVAFDINEYTKPDYMGESNSFKEFHYVFSKNWSYELTPPNSGSITRSNFSGSIRKTYSIYYNPTLTSNVYRINTNELKSNEEIDIPLNEKLIELFGIQSSSGGEIKVTSSVDFTRPDIYNIVFENIDGISIYKYLEVDNVAPVLTTNKKVAVINQGGNLSDILKQVNLTATEFETNDLISRVVYDDSTIDYGNAGEYKLNVSVSDDENTTDTVQINVLVSQPKFISGNDNVSIMEEHPLSDKELLERFNISSSDTLANITVNQSNINYSIPGNYSVTFKAEGYISFTTNLEIKDSLPELTVNNDNIEIDINSDLSAIKEQLDVTATEISENDLINEVIYDDSNINYNTENTYELIISVSDEEGNIDTETIAIIVTDNSFNVINAESSASINEESVLTDSELIKLFNTTSTQSKDITVNQSKVNYSVPGIYDVVFSSENADSITTQLRVNDILPTLIVNKNELTIDINSDLSAIKEQLDVTATEISENDLINEVIYDDSNINYNTENTYELIISVSDEEGNIDTEPITIKVASLDTDIVNDFDDNGLNETGFSTSTILLTILIFCSLYLIRKKIK